MPQVSPIESAQPSKSTQTDPGLALTSLAVPSAALVLVSAASAGSETAVGVTAASVTTTAVVTAVNGEVAEVKVEAVVGASVLTRTVSPPPQAQQASTAETPLTPAYPAIEPQPSSHPAPGAPSAVQNSPSA